MTSKHPWKLFFGPLSISPGQAKVVATTTDRVFRWHRFVNKGDVDGLWIVEFCIGSCIQQHKGGCKEFWVLA